MRTQLYIAETVSGWPRAPGRPDITIYPFFTKKGNVQRISVAWSISVEDARDLARQLTEACDAVEDAPAYVEASS